jgi:flagellar biosynthesis/type III secretory pathway protein FliH
LPDKPDVHVNTYWFEQALQRKNITWDEELDMLISEIIENAIESTALNYEEEFDEDERRSDCEDEYNRGYDEGYSSGVDEGYVRAKEEQAKENVAIEEQLKAAYQRGLVDQYKLPD